MEVINFRSFPERNKDKKKENSRLRKNAKIKDTTNCSVTDVYENVERRKLLIKEFDAYGTELAGLYTAELLDHSVPLKKYGDCAADVEIENDAENEKHFSGEDDLDEETNLPLPKDGGIFVDGVPFHHRSLKPLNATQIERLMRNGIELNRRKFSKLEDEQLLRNWTEYSEAYGIAEYEAPRYMGTSGNDETAQERKERLDFIQRTQFRPWMCKRLLNRSCIQVFRRCYHLFREDREWLPEDDETLLELYETHRDEWEHISEAMCRTRYACQKRHRFLSNESGESKTRHKWTNAETVRLYARLLQKMPVHPVLVAVMPDVEQYEESLNWDSICLKVRTKSAGQCRKRWQQIKEEFRAAKARLGTDLVDDVERAVFSNSRLVSGRLANVFVQLRLTCDQLIEALETLLDLCRQNDISLLRNFKSVDLNAYDKRLATILHIPYEVHNPSARVLRRLSFILHMCSYHKVFNVLPLRHNTLEVKIRAIIYVLRRGGGFKLRKRKVCKFVRKFVREQGWQPREQIVLIDRLAAKGKPHHEEANSSEHRATPDPTENADSTSRADSYETDRNNDDSEPTRKKSKNTSKNITHPHKK